MNITIEITLSVNTYEQAQAIYDANESGMLETLIKDRVLYGGALTSALVGSGSTVSAAKKEEASIELRTVETKAPRVAPAPTGEQKPERTRGLMGRGRINRSGRGQQ